MVVPRSRPPENEMGASTHWQRYSTVGASVIIAIGGLASLAHGQARDAADADANAGQQKSIHRVLIPVDDHGRQASTKYYVSEAFARELFHAAAKIDREDRRWLLKDIEYRGELRERTEPAGIVVGELTITCDVDVLARDTTIVLPFMHDEAAWPASAMLDGVPVPIEWREGGRACAVAVAEPGRYSLVITVLPRTTVVSGRNVVSLSIQPMLGATLRLDHPPDLAGLTVSGATSPKGVAGANFSDFELGQTERLEIQWPASDVALNPQSGRITQLEWLQLSNDGIELLTKYIFEGEPSESDDVVLAYDAAWDLLQDDGSPSRGVVRSDSGDRRTIRFQLPRNDAERKDLVVRWRLSARQILGRLKLSPIELISHPVAQRWRGVSASTSIECDVAGTGASSGTATEFLALWGDDGEVDPPQIVLGNVQAGQLWNFATKPRQVEPDIAEELHVAADGGVVRLVYQGAIVPGSVHERRFSLVVPPGLVINEITVAQSGRQIPLRWSRIRDDRVNVFFGQELSEAFQVTLSGSVETAHNNVVLPMVGAIGSDDAITIQLYRGDDVTLSVAGLPAPDQFNNAPLESPPDSWKFRHVAGYRLDKKAAANMRIQVEPNRAELAGDSATTLSRNSDGWLASFQAEFTVTRGTLDALHLHVPPEWRNGATLDASAPASISLASRNEQGATLSIRFAESIPAGSAVKVRVESPMIFTAATVFIPHVLPTPPLQGRRFLCVPSELNGQLLAWRSAGLRKTALPVNFRPTSDFATDTQVFECTAEGFQLVMQPRIGTTDMARVRLADMTVSLDPRGGQLMTTRFIVEPQGLPHCTLRVPDNQQLVAMRLAGSLALAHRSDDREWQVALGPPRLPSILEVVTRSSEYIAAGIRNEIRRPALLSGSEPIPVEINLWSLGYPDTTPRPAIGISAESTIGEQAVLRFDRLLSIVESATPAAIESPKRDGYNWYRRWSVLLTRLRDDAVATSAKLDGRQAASQVSRPTEEQLNESLTRLEAWIQECTETLSGSEANAKIPEMWSRDSGMGRESFPERWIYCVTDGGLDRLIVDNASDNVSSQKGRAIGVLAVVGLSAAAVLLLRSPGAFDLIIQWPHAVGFLIGIACWAWLQPSWCGLLIAAACIVLALRSGWPGRAIRLDASTVMRASRPK
jgi:hypothetical protein